MTKPTFYKQIKIIDNAINTGNLSVEALSLIKDASYYRNYFFKNVNSIEWFSPLKKENHFSSLNAPGLKLDEKKGLYSIPEWNVLPYLEHISEQVSLPGNERYIDELLEIIKDVSTAEDKKDNYRTWLYFVKILVNIPREKIPIDVIELITVWLGSKFDASHVGSEIGLKLLPKFLTENFSNEDIIKAEKIVEYITAFKAVKLDEERAKRLGKEEELKLVIDSFWLKEIFEKHSKDIGEKCTNYIIFALSDRIRPLLKRDEPKISLEISDKAYLLTLSSEESKYVVKIFDMGVTSASNIYEYISGIKKIEVQPIKELSVPETSMEDFVVNVFKELAKNPPFSEMKEAILKKDIYHLYRNFHDSETYASLYEESRSHLTKPLEVLTFILKSILRARARKHVAETKGILNKFSKDKYYYFPKIALYIIGNNIASYEGVFWDALEGESDCFFYESIYFGDELRHVLEELHPLSSKHKEILKTTISKGVQKKLDEKEDEKYILKWKQERCHALIKDPEFKELYDSLKAQTGRDVTLRAAVGDIKVRSGEGPAPLTKAEILNMPNDKLAEYLSSFKSKGFWEGGPTVGGLGSLIKECSSEQPGKFINNLTPFTNTGFIYIYEILDGAREAWNNKKDIDWGKLFDFIKRYIDRNEFWGDQFIVEKGDFLGGADHFWIVGATMELFHEGTRDDSRAYCENYFDIAEKIIFLILSKLEDDKEKDITDYVTHALNSSYGKTLIALINHSLRIARVNKKKGGKSEIKWSEEIKEKYNELLEKNIIESWTLLGQYLPNLFYLDKVWAEEKVKFLVPKAQDDSWEAFMDGYLSIGTVYDYLYKLMIPHYQYGITHEFKEKRDNEHLVQNIALGYLHGYEKSDIENTESLFRKVLDDGTTQQLSDIIGFFWSYQKHIGDKKEESRKIIDRIISFWKWVYENKFKNKNEPEITDDDKKIQSDFAMLTAFLPEINEEYSEWLMLAAPYANENYNSSFFVEYLDKLDGPASIGYTGKIFLKMLAHFIPDFDKENIRSIVEKLYVNKNKKDANEICEIYGREGLEFLRDLYEKYN